MNNTEKKLNSSYQKLKSEISLLEEEINNLKNELSAKGNVFYMENKYLGVNCMVKGFLYDLSKLTKYFLCENTLVNFFA